MCNISKSIERIASSWDPHLFENGDCHTLAMALHEASAPDDAPAARKGTLYACLRKSVDEDGVVATTGYSHMIYVEPNGTAWDISGADADERWEENFDTDTPDKWGLRSELHWVVVPSQHPGYCDTHAWLLEHYGRINLDLQRELVNAIRTVSATAAPRAELESIY